MDRQVVSFSALIHSGERVRLTVYADQLDIVSGDNEQSWVVDSVNLENLYDIEWEDFYYE